MEIFQEILKFLNNSDRNIWIENDLYKIYLRKSKRYFQGTIYTCFDIGQIEVAEEFRYQGHGKRFIEKFHEINPYQLTMIESVLNSSLQDHLRKNGWVHDTGNYYKLKQ